jgi:hypothetical protein
MGGGQRHPGGVGAGQGAALEGLDHEPAPVDHAGFHSPGQQRTDQGSAVAVVAQLEGGGVVAAV